MPSFNNFISSPRPINSSRDFISKSPIALMNARCQDDPEVVGIGIGGGLGASGGGSSRPTTVYDYNNDGDDDESRRSITISLRRNSQDKIERKFFDRRCLRIKQMSMSAKPAPSLSKEARRIFSSVERRRSRAGSAISASGLALAQTESSSLGSPKAHIGNSATKTSSEQPSQNDLDRESNRSQKQLSDIYKKKPKSANDANRTTKTSAIPRIKSAPSRHLKITPTHSDDEMAVKVNDLINPISENCDEGGQMTTKSSARSELTITSDGAQEQEITEADDLIDIIEDDRKLHSSFNDLANLENDEAENQKDRINTEEEHLGVEEIKPTSTK